MIWRMVSLLTSRSWRICENTEPSRTACQLGVLAGCARAAAALSHASWLAAGRAPAAVSFASGGGAQAARYEGAAQREQDAEVGGTAPHVAGVATADGLCGADDVAAAPFCGTAWCGGDAPSSPRCARTAPDPGAYPPSAGHVSSGGLAAPPFAAAARCSAR